jgi:hypothetical protein
LGTLLPPRGHNWNDIYIRRVKTGSQAVGIAYVHVYLCKGKVSEDYSMILSVCRAFYEFG